MEFHIGTSGFAFPGWRTQVYPYSLKPAQMFDYYCRRLGFDCLELNSTFYHFLSPKRLESLARRSPEKFRFTVKIHHAFTHNSTEAPPEIFRRFLRGIAPLAEAGKLSGLLAQFPPSFPPGKRSREWLLRLRGRLAPFPLFLEFRNKIWAAHETLAFLRKENIGWCMSDLPALSYLPPFIPAATNGTGYIRLHGRNRNWFRPEASRYDYHYSDAELRSLLKRVSGIPPTVSQVFLFCNNCHGGAAVRSANRCRELLGNFFPVSLPGLN
jgi:uncharacterized protein YecE (DUF72 family)